MIYEGLVYPEDHQDCGDDTAYSTCAVRYAMQLHRHHSSVFSMFSNLAGKPEKRRLAIKHKVITIMWPLGRL